MTASASHRPTALFLGAIRDRFFLVTRRRAEAGVLLGRLRIARRWCAPDGLPHRVPAFAYSIATGRGTPTYAYCHVPHRRHGLGRARAELLAPCSSTAGRRRVRRAATSSGARLLAVGTPPTSSRNRRRPGSTDAVQLVVTAAPRSHVALNLALIPAYGMIGPRSRPWRIHDDASACLVGQRNPPVPIMAPGRHGALAAVVSPRWGPPRLRHPVVVGRSSPSVASPLRLHEPGDRAAPRARPALDV